MRIKWIVPVLSLMGFAPAMSGSEGLRSLPDGAQSQGRIGGKIADVSDPTAVRTNPARLTSLLGPSVQTTATFLHGSTDHDGAQGRTSMVDPWKQTGSAFLAWPLPEQGLALGVGISAPFGLGVSYPRDGAFRYIAPEASQLNAVAFNPALAWQIFPDVSIGISGEIMRTDLKMTQAYPWFLATGSTESPDGLQRIEADGIGYGAAAAISWDISDRHSVSIVGRLPTKVDLEGDFSVTNRPGALAAIPAQNDFESEIEFPGSLGIGYAFRLTERITLSSDAEWIGNSTHDDLPIGLGTSQALFPDAAVPLDWEDSITYGLGVQCKINDHWTLRAGWQFSNSPIPNRTFHPAIPTGDRTLWSIGLGYSHGAHAVDLAYVFGLYDDLEIAQNLEPGFNGAYAFEWHALTANYRYSF